LSSSDNEPLSGVFLCPFAPISISSDSVSKWLTVAVGKMSITSRQEQLESLIIPIVEALGCIFWGLVCKVQGQTTSLCVFIDKDTGVTLTDCEIVSRQISSVMDVEDPIIGRYVLEVSSPGVNRQLFTLDHYRCFVGEIVAVRLLRSHEGRRNFKGVLVDVEQDEVVLRVHDNEYLLPWESIATANLAPVFN
jgi:ribosome maturation factor RimP